MCKYFWVAGPAELLWRWRACLQYFVIRLIAAPLIDQNIVL